MEIVNQITNSIVKNARDRDTIHSLAKKTGFAYSAVYKWVKFLGDYGVVDLIDRGNKIVIRINDNDIYKKFMELNKAINVVKNDKLFWEIIRKIKLKIRFTKSTAIVIWTKGGYVTGDFLDKIYFLDVHYKDLDSFKKVLKENKIAYSENKVSKERPLIYITCNNKEFKTEFENELPVVPLQELVEWCKELQLDNILEQLDLMYKLGLKVEYSDIKTL